MHIQVVQHIVMMQSMPSLINTLPDDTTQKELSRHLSLKGTRRYGSECVRRYMHIIINFHSKQLTQSICVHGKSVCLTSLTTELLANFTILQSS